MSNWLTRLFGGKPKPEADARRMVVAQSWLSQDAYRGTDAQFDPNAAPVELPIYGVPPPTLVKIVAAIIQQLEQGAFYAPSYLWDGMSRDERIAATLNVRISGLLGSTLDLEPALDTNRARKVKEDTEKLIGKMLPMHQMTALMRNGLGLSVGIAQVLTTRNAKSTQPTIKVWNNRNLRYDWVLRKYRLVTENRGEITVEAGDPEWIVYEPYGPHGWLNGALLRPLVLPWMIRFWTRTWWARYQEVHGQPIRAGIIPANREPADEKTFLAQISNLAHEAVIRLPQGEDGNKFDLKLIESDSTNWKGFEGLIGHTDRSIEIAILSQSQSTEGQGGLGTQENAGESTILRLLRGDAMVGEVIREQLVKPWAADNYGNADLAPYLKWQVDPPEDMGIKAKTLLTVAQAVQAFALAPAWARHVDVRATLEDMGLPLIPEDDVPPDVPDAPASEPDDEDEDPDEALPEPAAPADGTGDEPGDAAGDPPAP